MHKYFSITVYAFDAKGQPVLEGRRSVNSETPWTLRELEAWMNNFANDLSLHGEAIGTGKELDVTIPGKSDF